VALVAALPNAGSQAPPILVSAGGAVFEPEGLGRWQRKSLGGVAGEVLSAWQDETRLFAVPRETPLYEWKRGAWYARTLPNRGAIVVASGGAPVLAVGRHVHALSKNGWRRVTTAPENIGALWASDAQKIVAASLDQEILRFDGVQWSRVLVSMPAGDQVVRLFGAKPEEIIVSTRSGGLFVLSESGARVLAIPSELSGFLPEAAADSGAGLLLLGTRPTAAGRSGVIATVKNGALALVELVCELTADDGFTALVWGKNGARVATTRSGQVWIRGEKLWSQGEVIQSDVPTSGH
jgi:hypothetical protein